MTDVVTRTRRSFLGRMVTLTAGAGLGAHLAAPATANAATFSTRAPMNGIMVRPPGGALGAGFRAGITTRLAMMERHAELAPLLQGKRSFHVWTEERVVRLERLRGVTPIAQGGFSWADWMMARMPAIERFLPEPLRLPFYTHMPTDAAPNDYGPILRQRIADGSCNGIFLYMGSGPGNELRPTPMLDSITNSGGPVPILMSPKNVSDPVKLAAWMDYWAARPEWIPYVRVAYWQEPQGDFGGAGQPPLSVWQDNVITLADAADRVGIASVAHVETWHLHPIYKPDGGVPRLLQLLAPVVDRLGGGISWSIFVFNQKPRAANDYVRWMLEFMATNFPYCSYGVAAYGDSVHPSTPPNDPIRLARAERVRTALADLAQCTGMYGGYYAVPVGPDPSRSFWDTYVEAVVTDAIDFR